MWCKQTWVAVALALLGGVATVQGQSQTVFNMGEGLTSLEFVPVGNAGNEADTVTQPGRGAVSSNYMMGKFEVTAAQYTMFLNAVAGVDTYGLYNVNMFGPDQSGYFFGAQIERAGSGTGQDPYTYQVESDWANRPVNFVSWGDAARFVNWLHNGQLTGGQDLSTTEDGAYFLNGASTAEALVAVSRKAGAQYFLPTQDEWYKAAYHKNDGVTGNYFDYPTSNDVDPSNVLGEPDPGNNATFFDGSSLTDSSLYYFRTEVGAHENTLSPYGTHDQAGNVSEWNETVVGGLPLLRGGSWNSDVNSLSAATGFIGSVDPLTENSYYGFRVATVPEPGSLTLLLLGALMGFFYWRRRK